MEKLLGLWAKYPHLRLGQLIANSLPPTYQQVMRSIFNIEDFTLVEKVVEFDKEQSVHHAISQADKKEEG